MLRVTKPGGIVIYSYTVWLAFGGHETGLWEHYVGGEFAARRYRKRHGKEPKNRWGESLFDVSAADGVRYGWSTEGRVRNEPIRGEPARGMVARSVTTQSVVTRSATSKKLTRQALTGS